MITEDYVSFDMAKLLKEKGFNEICCSVYDDEVICSVASLNRHYECGYGDLVITCQNTDYDDWENKIAAPTIQMAMKWLREVHNIHINLDIHWLHFANSKGWMYVIERILENGMEHIDSKGDEDDKTFYSTYEEACEAAIKYSLEKLI